MLASDDASRPARRDAKKNQRKIGQPHFSHQAGVQKPKRLVRRRLGKHHCQARGKAAMAEQPYAAIRRGKAKPGMAAEFAVRAKAGALPAMRKMASKVII
jgi:hypothetical protein